ncbi:hypothetical protein M9H77_09361 [Catharanthus roseus]|uniref:Uncharacterized protein n=1 Tax=Catharanthus roseus TaxID=4058 RepID=A0ACC0C0J1_CATRO|nr:hypothetical protein M9H77_09361 [Catharanthus roseus]
MAEIVSAVAGKACEYLVAPVGRQFVYLYFFNKKLENLREQNEHLENMKVGVEVQVDEARRNLQVIGADVEAWLSKVENTSSCFRGWCLHTRSGSGSGYSLSKRAKKMGKVALELQGRGKLERVSYPVLITCVATTSSGPGDGDLRCFESRNLVMKEIMEALQHDDETSMIQICGMVGTGKTILVKEIAQRAMSDRICARLMNDSKIFVILDDVRHQLL